MYPYVSNFSDTAQYLSGKLLRLKFTFVVELQRIVQIQSVTVFKRWVNAFDGLFPHSNL